MKKTSFIPASKKVEETKTPMDSPQCLPPAADVAEVSGIKWHDYIDYAVPNSFKKWSDPTGTKEGIVVTCVAGKYKLWSAFFYLDREKREWRPSQTSIPFVLTISGPDYEKLLKIYEGLS